jgi:hypothetical protein
LGTKFVNNEKNMCIPISMYGYISIGRRNVCGPCKKIEKPSSLKMEQTKYGLHLAVGNDLKT